MILNHGALEPRRDGASTGVVAEEKKRERNEISCMVIIQENMLQRPDSGTGEVRLQITGSWCPVMTVELGGRGSKGKSEGRGCWE